MKTTTKKSIKTTKTTKINTKIKKYQIIKDPTQKGFNSHSEKQTEKQKITKKCKKQKKYKKNIKNQKSKIKMNPTTMGILSKEMNPTEVRFLSNKRKKQKTTKKCKKHKKYKKNIKKQKTKNKMNPTRVGLLSNVKNLTEVRFKSHRRNKFKKTKPKKKIIKLRKNPKKLTNKEVHTINGNISMKYLNWNKGNSKLVNKIDTLQNILSRFKPDIVAIQELNFTNDQDLAEVMIPNYKWEMDGLLQKNGRARSALLIHEAVRYSRRKDLETEAEAHVWITINLPAGRKINVQSWYRQWQEMGVNSRIEGTNTGTHVKNRITKLTDKWLKASQENETVSFSDTNLNMVNLNKLPNEVNPHDRKQIPAIRILRDKILNNGISIIPTKGTRYNYQSKNEECIDHCMTTHPERLLNQTIHKTGDSDHYIGQFNFSTITKPTQPRYVMTRQWDKINWDLVKLNLSNDIDLDQTNHIDDPSKICQIIQSSINYQLDNMAPLRKVQIKSKYPAFTSSETRTLMDERDTAYEDARRMNDQDQWRYFRNLRNRVHKEMKKDKKKFITKELDGNRDEKEKWDATKKFLGWTKNTTPTIISNNGVISTSPKEIAKVLNHHLVGKVAATACKIPKTSTNPLHNYSKMMAGKVCTFQIKKITVQELRNTILKLKTSHSAGMDRISSKMLKQILSSIEKPMTRLVNTSIETKTYPKPLKKSKVIPLLKNSSKSITDPASYRGVNIIMTIGKVIDRVILTQVLEYLKSNNLIHEAHHGALKGKSTTTAIATLVDTWTNLVEAGHELAIVALDQSSAYNLIDHRILLNKMEILGFQQETLQWFSSFLQDREQCVYVDGNYSDYLHIGKKSVIQGSVMSCLLYLIYIMDIPNLFHSNQHSVEDTDSCSKPSIQTFVDDLMTTIRKNPQEPLQTTVEESLIKIEDYMRANLLSLNRDKTQVMVLNRDPILQTKISISAKPKDITNRSSMLFLGVTISDRLNWSQFLTDGKANLYKQLQTRVSAL